MNSMRVLLPVPEEAAGEVTHIFRQFPQVEVPVSDPFSVGAQALIVPINSFGFFDSGFPLKVADRFGLGIQQTLQDNIRKKHFGELLVGEAEVLLTGVKSPSLLIAAPVVRTSISTLADSVNVYLAMRGAVLSIRNDAPEPVESLCFPMEAVLGAGLTPYAAARQVREGLRVALRETPKALHHLSKEARREKSLKRPERKSGRKADERPGPA